MKKLPNLIDGYSKDIEYQRQKSEQPAAAEPTEKKGKGRPRTAPPCHKKQIAIPDELLEKYDQIKDGLGNNLTAYLVELMRVDLEKNFDNYKAIQDMKAGILSRAKEG